MAMHALRQIEAEIDATHSGLGRLVACVVLCYSARKTMMIVAPAGTGKSASTQSVKELVKDVYVLDSVTRNGMQSISGELNGSNALWIVDDLGKIDTHYNRVATITSFCELVYSHFVEKHAQGVSLSISDFNGSAVINCQPGPLRRIVETNEWEATIQDKTLRYYHLFRPLAPERKRPAISTRNIPLIKAQDDFVPEDKLWQSLVRLGLVQWSRARTNEHMADFLHAAALLDGRNKVSHTDYEVLIHILTPMIAERFLMEKKELDGGRVFNASLNYLMVECASYGTFPLDLIVENYKVSEAVAMALMRSLNRYVDVKTNSPILVVPKEPMQRILNLLGSRSSIKEGE